MSQSSLAVMKSAGPEGASIAGAEPPRAFKVRFSDFMLEEYVEALLAMDVLKAEENQGDRVLWQTVKDQLGL